MDTRRARLGTAGHALMIYLPAVQLLVDDAGDRREEGRDGLVRMVAQRTLSVADVMAVVHHRWRHRALVRAVDDQRNIVRLQRLRVGGVNVGAEEEPGQYLRRVEEGGRRRDTVHAFAGCRRGGGGDFGARATFGASARRGRGAEGRIRRRHDWLQDVQLLPLLLCARLYARHAHTRRGRRF